MDVIKAEDMQDKEVTVGADFLSVILLKNTIHLFPMEKQILLAGKCKTYRSLWSASTTAHSSRSILVD